MPYAESIINLDSFQVNCLPEKIKNTRDRQLQNSVVHSNTHIQNSPHIQAVSNVQSTSNVQNTSQITSHYRNVTYSQPPTGYLLGSGGMVPSSYSLIQVQPGQFTQPQSMFKPQSGNMQSVNVQYTNQPYIYKMQSSMIP